MKQVVVDFFIFFAFKTKQKTTQNLLENKKFLSKYN